MIDICYLLAVRPQKENVVFRFEIFNECLAVVFVQLLLVYTKEMKDAMLTGE